LNKIPLLGETKEKMLYELRGGKKTAKDLASSLGIQVSAARKHLEALYVLNIVREEFIQNGIGRPKKFYDLTEDGRELFPRQYERMLCGVLAKLNNAPALNPESMVKEIAHEIAKDMSVSEEKDDLARVETLVGALNDFGFDSKLEETHSGFIITSHNCPLHKVAMQHQKLVCHSFHDEMIKTALDTRDVKLECCLSRGDNVCKHIVGKRKL
jgi:predicted ArsR family transcriptional regulator